jgi:hypothetical protein
LGLRTSNPHDWWRHTKQLLGQQEKPQSGLQSLINDAAGGDAQLLADLINRALQQVSKDLIPLSDLSAPEVNDIPSEYIIRPDEVFTFAPVKSFIHVSVHFSE